MQACDPGTYANTTGNTDCSLCPAGWFNTFDSTNSCQPCPVGTSQPDKRSNACTVSSDVLATQHPATACVHDLEYYLTTASHIHLIRWSVRLSSLLLQPCSIGSYANTTGSTECIDCPSGWFSDQENSTSCQPCPAGKSSYSGSDYCYTCSAGTYSPSGSRCQACKPGSFSARGSSQCTTCPVGTNSDEYYSDECTVS